MKSTLEIRATKNEIRDAIELLTDLLNNDMLPYEMIFHNGEGQYAIEVYKEARDGKWI